MAARKQTPRDAAPALVIVESPAKARTIARYLGKDYVVLASIGHIRDLPSSSAELDAEARRQPWSRLGVDVEHDFAPYYVIPVEKREQVKSLRRLLKDAPSLWLATDEDREGEAIAWHLVEVLKPTVPTRRLVFHEITEEAIREALASPREIDARLVEAQETRRILDRLFGYEVSPVLWRKIRKNLSAGRVQSVALRLLVERERERIAFRSATWFDLEAEFTTHLAGGESFEATLVSVGGRRLATGKDFDPTTGRLASEDLLHLDEEAAWALDARLSAQRPVVRSVEEKPYVSRPPAPFTTSTLQQEAARKLRQSVKRTMQVAQDLYQNGVITYMRTDSTSLSSEAIEGARRFVKDHYGPEYLPAAPRRYATKVKNAQEAHEAIRPAGRAFASVDDVRRQHGEEAAALYELIWMRTVASQMTDARGRNLVVDVGLDDGVFRATGRTIDFPGFQRAYVEGSDDPRGELQERERLLPRLAPGQELHTLSMQAQAHETQPPSRYTEASLVKELERRGIGRPSTWASIIAVLLDREYAFRRNGSLVPTFTGFAVVGMLRLSFGELVDYEFTARMEEELDEISRGEREGKAYLRRFYLGNGRPGLRALVASGLDEVDPRTTCSIPLGEVDGRAIEARVGRYGLFVTDGEANASLPEQTVPDELTWERARALLDAAAAGPTALGTDPATGQPVVLRSGPYGPYVQLGQAVPKGPKPKMQSLLKGMAPGDVTLEVALRLLALPRDLGPHPEDPEGRSVIALTGRYGPFVKWGSESRSLPDDTSVLDVTLERAVALLKEPRRRGRGSTPAALKELGAHPGTGKPLRLLSGRYGPYVTDGQINASLAKGQDPGALTVEDAVELLARRAARLAEGGGRRPAARRKPPSRKK